MMDVKVDLLQWLINSFDKNFSGGAVARANKSGTRSEIMLNHQFVENLQKPIIRKSEKQNV